MKFDQNFRAAESGVHLSTLTLRSTALNFNDWSRLRLDLIDREN